MKVGKTGDLLPVKKSKADKVKWHPHWTEKVKWRKRRKGRLSIKAL